MSRFCGEVNTAPILGAAERWREVALLGEGSVLTDKRVWTAAGLDALDQHFVQNLDEGEGTFLEKLQHQLAESPPQAKQLAAEMMWLMYLCPSGTRPSHKRKVLEEIWAWSKEPFPKNSPMLVDSVLSGIGSAGTAYNVQQWRELVFVIRFTRAFRGLSLDERKRKLNDGWAFAEWLKEIPDWEARQFRHMLLYLLFPDQFERIFGQTDRKRIVETFTDRDADDLDAVEIDRSLAEIRKKLESELGTTKLDFYVSPVKEKWKSTSFAAETQNISAAHVRQAIADIARQGIPHDAQSTTYDLIDKGNRYPPKYVLSLAAKHANGEEFDRAEFTGGEDSPAFALLRQLGFEIEPKDAIPALLSKFKAQADAAKELAVQGYLTNYRDLTVRVSFGKGNFARIPWIAFLAEGEEVSQGIYPVLLLFRDQNVLLLCYGLSEENEPEKSWGDVGNAQTVNEWFREKFARGPDRYGASFVRAAYDLRNPLPVADLNTELDRVIDQYRKVMGMTTVETVSPPPARTNTRSAVRIDLAAAVRTFADALRNSYVNFGAKHDELVLAFVSSLVTKPLVVLTGLSGSGKTQIAIRFGEWLGVDRLHVAAVRPDWTGAEALFGYEDGLKQPKNGRAAWNVPGPLEFMLRAARDPQHPYLLVLDEMNLAHVERYFADVLSGMESGHECLPNLTKGDDGIWRIPAGAQARIAFPRNVWIVGTVNVDETTYMFSPKVLDRANTFEFRVNVGDLNARAQKPIACRPGDEALVRGLLSLASDDAWQEKNPSTFGSDLDRRLRQLHALLARHGLEFGHRMFYEALRFAALAEMAGLVELDQALDRLVIQKVLPRLHGSRKRLEPSILALMHFCRDLPDVVETDEKLPTLNVDTPITGTARLPSSYDKLSRMLKNLRANQFVSFTE